MKRNRNWEEASTSKYLPSSEATSSHKYDIFLSFRGPDTRNKFTSHLYSRLQNIGFKVFKDDAEMVKGEGINQALKRAINDSKICIPILSKSYASSKACLEELSHMVLEQKTIIPVFYDVGADDVKLKTDLYKTALEKHHQQGKVGKEEIEKWKNALLAVGKVLAYDVVGKSESNEITEITRDIFNRLMPKNQNVGDPFVEIDDAVDSVIRMLDINSKGCRIIGICGMGGIGKTTLAKVVFNRLRAKFYNYCSFIANVRERAQNELPNLQRQLYKDIVDPNLTGFIDDTNSGINCIKKGLMGKKFLLVLDDMDDENMLTNFVGDPALLASGSKIIITTRNKRVFDVLKVDSEVYQLQQLDHYRALELFSMCAFRRNSPPERFKSLSRRFISSLGGLPLALTILGSSLFGLSEEMWEEKMERLKKTPDTKIQSSLMISYEGLEKQEREIFLDIACYPGFLGKRCAYYMWKDSEWQPSLSIKNLINQSLVKIEVIDGVECFLMHDMLKDLGREIVHERNGRKGERFLQINDDHWKIPNEGRKYVEMLKIDSYSKTVTSSDLEGFKNVRFLQLKANKIEGNFEGLFPNLRWTDIPWVQDFTVTNFYLKNVVVLQLQCLHNIDLFWSQMKAHKLKVLDISWSSGVNSMSFNEFSSLEVLDLSYAGINVLPNAIWQLEELRILRISGSPITRFPITIVRLMKLEELVARGCEKFEGDIPSEISMLSCLRIFDLRGTPVCRISKLPSSLTHLHFDSLAAEFEIYSHNLFELVNVVELTLCEKSVYRPYRHECLDFQWIESLTLLEKLYLHISYTITGLENVSRLSRLEELNLSFAELSDNFQLPSRLSYLRLNGCKCDVLDISHAKKLRELQIWRCDTPEILVKELDSLVQLEMREWRSLSSLKLWKCKNLKELRLFGLSSFLIDLSIRDCPSLEYSAWLEKSCLSSLELWGLKAWNWACEDLVLANLTHLSMKKLGIKSLKLIECGKLESIEWLDGLESLTDLSIENCPSLGNMSDLSLLRNLQCLRLHKLKSLRCIQGLTQLEFLESIFVTGCQSLELGPDDLCKLNHTRIVLIQNCNKLPRIQNWNLDQFTRRMC